MSDYELARQKRLAVSTVADERRRRGIPPFKPRRPAVEWTAERIALLGTDTDGKVAARLGLSTMAVQRRRFSLGIPPYAGSPFLPPGHEWTRREIRLLGTLPDRKVAKILGLSDSTVMYKRQALRIPPYRRRLPPIRWTKKMLSLLGKVPDVEIARRYRISVARVRRKRYSLGIPGHVRGRVAATPSLLRLLRLPTTLARKRTKLSGYAIAKLRREHGIEPQTYDEFRWPPEVVAQLGKVPDEELARRLGRTRYCIAQRRRALKIPSLRFSPPWRRRELALLGKLPDQVVAQKLGRSVVAVAHKRRALAGQGRPDAENPWTPERIAQLGRVPDKKLARELGIHPSRVIRKRRSLRILPMRPARRWKPHELDLLDTLPDEVVARKLGRSVIAVKSQRQNLHRPQWRGKTTADTRTARRRR
jgi:hypothetical protein